MRQHQETWDIADIIATPHNNSDMIRRGEIWALKHSKIHVLTRKQEGTVHVFTTLMKTMLQYNNTTTMTWLDNSRETRFGGLNITKIQQKGICTWQQKGILYMTTKGNLYSTWQQKGNINTTTQEDQFTDMTTWCPRCYMDEWKKKKKRTGSNTEKGS
jgi:hypothetical protein